MQSQACHDILIVDESHGRRLELYEMLGFTGFEIRFCADASEACWAIESNRPSFVICSWQMPDMTGFELCRWVRARERGSHLYFILLEEFGAYFSRAKTGVDDFVSVPLRREELLASIRRGEEALTLGQRMSPCGQTPCGQTPCVHTASPES